MSQLVKRSVRRRTDDRLQAEVGLVDSEMKTRILAEIDKDLTKLPIGEIEKHLVG
jgi:hypothetical protein